MKKTLKLAGLLLALVMVISALPVMASAAADSYTITITNAVDGKVYSAYKIFDIESLDTTANPVKATYKVLDPNPVASLFTTEKDGLGDACFVIDEQGYVTAKTGVTDAQLAAFAKAALALVSTADATATAAGDPCVATIDVGEDGYFLVDSTIGSLCILTSAATTATIAEKNTEPTITKTVTAIGTDTTDKATASIGEVVSYSVAITADEGAEKYVYTDKMDNGLTWSGSVVVNDGTADLAAGDDYTLVTTGLGEGETFKVVFAQDYLDTIADATTITITYTATVNENAIADTGSIDNKADLTYGDDGVAETSTASINTYSFDVVKTDASNNVITGAQFKLYDAATGGNEIKVVKLSDGSYRVALSTETGVVIEAGEANIDGLGNGTYYLEEVKQPDGYNKLAERKAVTINGADNLATVTSNVYSAGGLQVINQAGSLLPETGGIGTTIFYVIGAILVVGAGVLLVAKKRMAAK